MGRKQGTLALYNCLKLKRVCLSKNIWNENPVPTLLLIALWFPVTLVSSECIHWSPRTGLTAHKRSHDFSSHGDLISENLSCKSADFNKRRRKILRNPMSWKKTQKTKSPAAVLSHCCLHVESCV